MSTSATGHLFMLIYSLPPLVAEKASYWLNILTSWIYLIHRGHFVNAYSGQSAGMVCLKYFLVLLENMELNLGRGWTEVPSF